MGIARAAKLADVACRQSSRQEPVGMRMHWHSTEICLFHLVIVTYADINQVDESCDDVTKLPNQAILGCPHEPSLQRLHSEVTMMYPHSCFIRLLRFHHPRDNPQHPATGIRLGMVPPIFPPWPLRLGSHLRFVLLRCSPRCWEGTNCTWAASALEPPPGAGLRGYITLATRRRSYGKNKPFESIGAAQPCFTTMFHFYIMYVNIIYVHYKMIITRKCWHFVPVCGGLHHGYLASQLSQARRNMKDRLGEIDKHEQNPLKMTFVCFREGREEQHLNAEWFFLLSSHSRRQTWLLQMHAQVPLLFVV